MRLIGRAVLRETWPPFLIGFGAYTFLLLLRTIFLLTDLFVRRTASAGEVAWMVVLSVPWIVVLTIPMAFLLGVLVGVGRLSSDSELIALRSCGVGPWAIFRPLLSAGVGLAILVFVLYDVALPRTNEILIRSMARLAATSVVNVVSPRTFRQPRPGVTLFFDRAGADGRSLEGVFLALGDEALAGTVPDEIIVARRGALTVENDRLWLDLEYSTVHQSSALDPSRYRVSANRAQRILFAGSLGPDSSGGQEKGLRAQSLSELLASARRARQTSFPERYRLAWVEIHKKLAIPFACIAFALVGIPLAETSRRGGRGSSFALSLAILVVYYVLLSSGESWAASGTLSPGLAIWLPDLGLLALGLLFFLGRGREWRGLPRLPRRLPKPEREEDVRARRPRWASLGGFLRFPAILDRYVLARFLSSLALVLLSVLFVSTVVDYADQSDEILRNHPAASAVAGYYRSFLLGIASQAAPFVVLVAALLALGALARHSEDTACRASGISLYRLGAPILVAAVAAAGGAFWLSERILPEAARQEARYRNVIRGKPPEHGLAASGDRDWHYDPAGRIWHREEGPPGTTMLLSPSVFELSPDFRLVRRTAARRAEWSGSAWQFQDGWSRSFDGAQEASYEAFASKQVAGESPAVFRAESRTPAQMRYRELQHYARRLARSGYPTESLETALAERISKPMLLPLMALLGVPFAFRLGKRGTLAGIGTGLALGMALLIASELFSRLGSVGALPPMLAAWTPNVLFGTAAAFLLVKLRT